MPCTNGFEAEENLRNTSLNCLFELAQKDERVVFIGSDLGPGVMDDMKKELPDRFFMEGVSEQHIVGMAAGLAMEGFIPFVNTIATFLTRRCFEQVALDVCLHDLPVRLIANGGGVVYAPLGPTHLATEDLAILRALPNMTIIAPCDANEMTRAMDETLVWPGPIYVRIAKGGDEIISCEKNKFSIGKAIVMRDPGKVLFVTTGIITQRALHAAARLSELGISAGVLHVHTVKPFDIETLIDSITDVELIVTAEEHILTGGLGSAVLEAINDRVLAEQPRITRMGLSDRFSEIYGSQEDILEANGLGITALVERAQRFLIN